MESEPRDLERVRVAVRVRPRNAREEALETQSHTQHVLDVDPTTAQIYVCKKKTADRNASGSDQPADRELRCSFDRVFAASATQDDVFDYVRDAVQQIAQGFNCTIFAYGQTGTGKTHTMLGRDLEKHIDGTATLVSRENWGVIPRAVESLFEELQSIARTGAAAAIVHCSYMQIYNNEVYDLLQENKARMKEPLAVREMIKGNDKQIYVSGLSEFRVTSLDETLRLLRQGNKNRTIRATEYNEKSSRSHALLQLSAEVESRGAEGPTTIIRRARLSLVDLAGSEKWASDVAMGSDRCKELTSINQSLSALGNVISALANPKRTHVPYRDAKLTRLLQDSLGGNTRTTVIATVSQDESAIEETISTLQFAERAKCVTLRVKVNEMVDDAVLLAQARREIARLKLLLKKNASQEQLSELEQKVVKLSRENAVLASENRRLKQAIAAGKKAKTVVNVSAADASVQQQPVETRPLDMNTQIASPRSSPQGNEDRRRGADQLLTRLPLDRRDVLTPTTERASSDDDHDANDDDRRTSEERDQTLLLEQIQSERRALEQELERIEQLQTPRRALQGDNNGVQSNDNDGDDLCPMCLRSIDDHSDDELDACIEEETAVMMKRDHATRNTTDSASHSEKFSIAMQEPSRPPNYAPQPRTPPPMRKPTTPRTSSVKKPASPYLHDLFSKAQPPGPVPRPQQSPSMDTAPSRLRRSVRDLTQARLSEANPARESEDARPSTADSNAKSGCQVTVHQEVARTLNNPIVHQGSKSVKALKKFQATSPYSTRSGTNNKAKTSSSSPPRLAGNNVNSTSEAVDRVTCSLRDIGLSLMVYKFRYDCWYPCTVVGFDGKRRLHCCQYEYGDKQWQDLSQNKLKIVGRAGGNNNE